MGMSVAILTWSWISSFTRISSCRWTITTSIGGTYIGSSYRESEVLLAAGHQMLDFYAEIPFYANMFSNAGFSFTSDQAVPDALVNSLVISGNESTINARFAELLVGRPGRANGIPSADDRWKR